MGVSGRSVRLARLPATITGSPSESFLSRVSMTWNDRPARCGEWLPAGMFRRNPKLKAARLRGASHVASPERDNDAQRILVTPRRTTARGARRPKRLHERSAPIRELAAESGRSGRARRACLPVFPQHVGGV